MPDSAQIEQELKQRQGVAKEDTLPPVENRDLAYVPPTTQVLYAPPKISLRQKYLSPVFHYIRLFIPEIIVFSLFIIMFFLAMNYFNFLPISTMYPKTLGLLPHRYDVEGNKKALSLVPYSSEVEAYELEGKFYALRGDRILIEYNGKFVEFLRSGNLSCNTELKKTNGNIEEFFIKPEFCSDILGKKSSGKKVYITYKKSSGGSYFIDYMVFKQ